MVIAVLFLGIAGTVNGLTTYAADNVEYPSTGSAGFYGTYEESGKSMDAKVNNQNQVESQDVANQQPPNKTAAGSISKRSTNQADPSAAPRTLPASAGEVLPHAGDQDYTLFQRTGVVLLLTGMILLLIQKRKEVEKS